MGAAGKDDGGYAPVRSTRSSRGAGSFGRPSRGAGSFGAPRPAPRPAPASAPAPIPIPGGIPQSAPAPSPYSGGGGGYDTGYGGGGGFAAEPYTPPPPPPPPNKDDWIASDAGYKAQRDALAKALADYETNYNSEIGQYDVDFDKGIRNLGWDMETRDDPTTKENESKGAWNLTDTTRASGRSYTNQTNDFANRNLLQSSLYAKAVQDLMRTFDDQFGSLNTSRQNFRNDKSRALTSYKTDNESQKNLAYADAASRYAALFGV